MLTPVRSDGDYATHLRGAGLRVTQPRLLVMRAIAALPTGGGAPLQQRLQHALQIQGRPLPPSTIHRVLRDLAAAGLLRAAPVAPCPSAGRTAGDFPFPDDPDPDDVS